jgi:hypothetical protein
LSSEPSHLDREVVLIHCNRLLRHFLQEATKLYGWNFFIVNLNCLLHLVDDVRRFDPLDMDMVVFLLKTFFSG